MPAETPSPPPDRGAARQPVREKGVDYSAAAGREIRNRESRASPPRRPRRSTHRSEDNDSSRARRRSRSRSRSRNRSGKRSRSRSGNRHSKSGSRRNGDERFATSEHVSRSPSRERKYVSRSRSRERKPKESKYTSRSSSRESQSRAVKETSRERKRDESREPYKRPRDTSRDRARDQRREKDKGRLKERHRYGSIERRRDRSKDRRRDHSRDRDARKDPRRERSQDRHYRKSASRRSASPLPYRPSKRRDRSPSPSRRHRRDSRSPTPNKSKRRKVHSRSPSPPPARSRKPLPSQEVSFRGLDNSDQPPTKYGGMPPDKEKPNFAPTGLLAKEANTVAGTKIALKYHEPPEARKPPPSAQWRLFVFKGPDVLSTIELHTQSCWLLGRAQEVADIVLGHPSSSQQHAAIQFRYITKVKEDEYGISKKTGKVKPYIIDLESSNGTELNGEKLEAGRYYELRDKDMVQFGGSEREYVIMLPPPEK